MNKTISSNLFHSTFTTYPVHVLTPRFIVKIQPNVPRMHEFASILSSFPGGNPPRTPLLGRPSASHSWSYHCKSRCDAPAVVLMSSHHALLFGLVRGMLFRWITWSLVQVRIISTTRCVLVCTDMFTKWVEVVP